MIPTSVPHCDESIVTDPALLPGKGLIHSTLHIVFAQETGLVALSKRFFVLAAAPGWETRLVAPSERFIVLTATPKWETRLITLCSPLLSRWET